MDEQEQARQFDRELERLVRGEELPEATLPQSDRQNYAVARRLYQMDLSRDSGVRQSLRQRLLDQSLRDAQSHQWRQNLSSQARRVIRPLAWVAVGVLAIAVLTWALQSLLPKPTSSFSVAGGNPAYPFETPASLLAASTVTTYSVQSAAIPSPTYPPPLELEQASTKEPYPPVYPTSPFTSVPEEPMPTEAPSPTIPPVPTRLPTPVVTPYPTSEPPFISLPPGKEAAVFTLVYRDGNTLRAVDSDGQNDRLLLDVSAKIPLFLISEGTWGAPSPDGKQLALELSTLAGPWPGKGKGTPLPQYSLYLFDLVKDDLRPLVQDGADPVWSPDGSQIAYRSTKTFGLWVVNVASNQTREVYQVDSEHEHFVDGYSWSPDSHRLVFVDEVSRQSSTILSIAIDGIEGAKVLVTGIYMPSFPEWSPNGTRILYISLAGESSSSDIFDNLWIMNADGTGQTQITRDLYVYSPPHWSPDGQWIVFAGPRFYEEVNTNYDLWIVDSKGKSIKRLTIGKANESMPNWSPDGAQIYFTRDNNDVWILSLATGQQTRLPLTAVDFITLPLITTVTSSSGFGETPPDWLLPGIEQALEIGDLSFFDRMTPEQVYYGLQGSEYFGSFSRSQFLAEVEARIGNRPMCTTYSYNIGEASVVWVFTTNWNPPWDFGGKAYSENLVFLFSDEGDKEKGLFLYGIAVNPTPDLFYGHGDYPCP